jgi:hypothetical protein
MRGSVRDNSFQTKILGVLGEVTPLLTYIIREIGELAFQFDEGLLLNLLGERQF